MEERAYWLAWAQLPGVGPVVLNNIYHHFGSLQVAWQATMPELLAVEGVGMQVGEKIFQGRTQINPEQFLETHSLDNPHFWTPADPDYPRLLLEIPSPPPVLYYRGIVESGENQGITPLVAIVGTREATDYGHRWSKKISTALAQQGVTVVSTMSQGVDASAHTSALQVGGRTIAVLPSPVDVAYPSQSRHLYEKILQQGLVVSEYPQGSKPHKGHFQPRGRIIAGLCRAVIVIEAPQNSGCLIIANYANEFGRDVYALPNSPEHPQSRGCLQLIEEGADLISELEKLLGRLGTIPKLDSPPNSLPDLSAELLEIWQCVGHEPTSLEMIIQTSGKDTSTITSGLLMLELEGLVTQLPGMRYQKYSI